MKRKDSKLTTLVVIACIMLVIFGISIGKTITSDNKNYKAGLDEPLLGGPIDDDGNIGVTSVRLDEHSKTLRVGYTGKPFIVTVLPTDATDKTVTWSSSNNSAVNVNSSTGYITVKSTASNVQIRVCSNENTNMCDSATVTAIAKSDPTPIQIYGCPTGMTVGETKTLSSIPTTGFTWTTMYGNNVSIDSSGVITALSPGAAAVYAKSDNDSLYSDSEVCAFTVFAQNDTIECDDGKYLPGQSTACETCPAGYYCPKGTHRLGDSSPSGLIKCAGGTYSTGGAATCSTCSSGVSNSDNTGCIESGKIVTGVTVDKNSITINNGSSASIKVTISPTDASNPTINWTSSNTSIVNVTSRTTTTNNPTITVNGIREGTATITGRTQDGSNKTVTIYVTVQGQYVTTGIMQVDKLTLAKNDASQYAFIPVFSDANGNTVTVPANEIKWKSASPNIVSVNAETGSAVSVKSYTTESSGVAISACVNSEISNNKEVCANATVAVTCKEWTLTSTKFAVSPMDARVAATKDGAQRSGLCYYYEVRDTSQAWDCVNSVKNGQTIKYCKVMNRCCGSSSPSTPTETKYACYANATLIENATEAAWLSEKQGNLIYEIPQVTDEGLCVPYACYGNAASIADATRVLWTNVQPDGYTKYTGVARGNCVETKKTPACYGNGVTLETSNDFIWSDVTPTGYTKFEGVAEENCKKPAEETPACYRDLNGEYHWGKYYTTVGYEQMPIYDEANCKKPTEDQACYRNASGSYYWGVASEGAVKVIEVDDIDNCGEPEEEMCYLVGSEYRWGALSRITGAVPVTSIKSAALCVNDAACYKSPDGNYYWGPYANNEGFVKVDNITSPDKCTNDDVYVPQTAASVQTIVYVFMTILVVAGLVFVYYAFTQNKKSKN